MTEEQTLRALEQAGAVDGQLLRRPDPCQLVIFGARGDLAHRKLFPALYALHLRKLLPETVTIVGVDMPDLDAAAFRKEVCESLEKFARDAVDKASCAEFGKLLDYRSGAAGIPPLLTELNKLDEEHGTHGNRAIYLALPPAVMETIAAELGKRRTTGKGFTRLIVEKPFGHDLASAQKLNTQLRRHFEENEIFRMDHFLGKSAVESFSVLRFSNVVLEPLWKREYIDHVQITVAEDIGIEGRASFYEQAGASKDVFQNHLLQLVALTAMEPPFDLKADSVRNEKVKVLKAMYTPSPKNVVRGQYGAGVVNGEVVSAYRQEPGVDPESMTETFVAAKLYVNNWRWADVPFYVRTGKRLPRRETTIQVHFKAAPHTMFAQLGQNDIRGNVLTIQVQPNEGASLTMNAKLPGQALAIHPVPMDFEFSELGRDMPEAYERLIYDVLVGDATLFMRSDEVEEQWKLLDAVVSNWEREPSVFPNYQAGTWGPNAADDLLARDGRAWSK